MGTIDFREARRAAEAKGGAAMFEALGAIGQSEGETVAESASMLAGVFASLTTEAARHGAAEALARRLLRDADELDRMTVAERMLTA